MDQSITNSSRSTHHSLYHGSFSPDCTDVQTDWNLRSLLMPHAVLSCDLALTLLHSERPKLYTILAFLSAKGLIVNTDFEECGNNSIIFFLPF